MVPYVRDVKPVINNQTVLIIVQVVECILNSFIAQARHSDDKTDINLVRNHADDTGRPVKGVDRRAVGSCQVKAVVCVRSKR